MCINQWMDREYVVYLYNETGLSNKKEQTTDTSTSRDKTQKHYAKWKKPDTRDYTLYAFIYMKRPE